MIYKGKLFSLEVLGGVKSVGGEAIILIKVAIDSVY